MNLRYGARVNFACRSLFCGLLICIESQSFSRNRVPDHRGVFSANAVDNVQVLAEPGTWIRVNGDKDPVLYQDEASKKFGFKNHLGQIIFPAKYDSVSAFNYGVATTKLDRKIGFFSALGKEIVEPKYEGVQVVEKGVIFVMLDGKLGIIDHSGKDIVRPGKYDQLFSFRGDFALVKLNGKFGLIDKKGTEVSALKYDEISSDFDAGLAMVKIGNKYGFINSKGAEVTPVKYDPRFLTFRFENGFRGVKAETGFGFINRNGKEIVEPRYRYVHDFSKEGYAKVKLGDLYGIIDSTGREVIKPIYSDIDRISGGQGQMKVRIVGKVGVIDRNGKMILPVEYNIGDIRDIDGRLIVKHNEKYGILDFNGKVIVPHQYDDIQVDADPKNGGGLYLVRLDGKYGYVDVLTGKEVIGTKYDNAFRFNTKEYTYVKLNGERFKIDRKGTLLEKVKYDFMQEPSHGLRRVQLDKKYGCIDLKGEEVVPLKYDFLSVSSEGGDDVYIIVRLGDKYGVVNAMGKEVIPIQYDSLFSFYQGVAKVKKDGKTIQIDRKGNEVTK